MAIDHQIYRRIDRPVSYQNLFLRQRTQFADGDADLPKHDIGIHPEVGYERKLGRERFAQRGRLQYR